MITWIKKGDENFPLCFYISFLDREPPDVHELREIQFVLNHIGCDAFMESVEIMSEYTIPSHKHYEILVGALVSEHSLSRSQVDMATKDNIRMNGENAACIVYFADLEENA
jgi:hypothetical protein